LPTIAPIVDQRGRLSSAAVLIAEYFGADVKHTVRFTLDGHAARVAPHSDRQLRPSYGGQACIP
jgi:hypothetical protein